MRLLISEYHMFVSMELIYSNAIIVIVIAINHQHRLIICPEQKKRLMLHALGSYSQLF